MSDRFTESAGQVLKLAVETAIESSNNYVGTEHLLIGLLSVQGVASTVLEANGVKKEQILQLVNQLISPPVKSAAVKNSEFTPRSEKIIEQSYSEAEKYKSDKAGTEHLLTALLKEFDCIAVRLLNTLGANVQKIYVDALTAMGQDANTAKNEYIASKNRNRSRTATPTLDQYSRDLSAYAKDGKLDPVIGREKEIQRVIQILSRRTKNNPCLIGEPGVGKTAIAEGLAQRIAEGNVPDTIKGKRVLTLDLSGMVAGSKYRGEFEERIKRTIAEVIASGNLLLFIDEIHTVIGAGGAEGAIDASNILKPSLARGELQLIGATTREEYRKYIEKDAALERRFQPVVVEEPTEEETIDILKGLRSRYESHHQVKILDEAINAAAKMSNRYINDRYLPDKAIDLIDEASSKVRLGLYRVSPDIEKLETKLAALKMQKEEAILREEYEEAGKIKKKQLQTQLQLDKKKLLREEETKNTDQFVGEEEIADIVSGWTKIPVQKLQEEESARLRKLEEILHQRVIGQDEAVVSVSKAIRRGRVGLKDPNRPIGSFLFLGPTGVGKTELTKALAEAVFGSEDATIRVDMSEYMEKHSVSKLIGSPPGYVGYEEGGQLSEKVRRQPYSVILFDEIEKAHPDVFNILLQVLDDGHITDAQGRKVSFKNTIIIMTSNAGAGRIIEPKKLGFSSAVSEQEVYESMKNGVMDEVKRLFKPEFLNRIDEQIVFHALTKENMKQIVSILLHTIAKRSKSQIGIELLPDEAAKEFIVEKGYDPKYGARPLKRAIQNLVEDEISEQILSGVIKEGDKVIISKGEKDLAFSVRKPRKKKIKS